MDIFNVLTLLGGLALFLYGMEIMGEGLKKSAGNKLKIILSKLTSNPITGFFLGFVVTAVIQSSSATTVMIVGFINSGIMTLSQAIPVIMGANLGTTATSWILSLSGIQGETLFLKLLKPSSFTPVLALIGIIIFMFAKSSRKKDLASIFLGFSVLMFGMETMSSSVDSLTEMESFRNLLTLFSNPILGVIVGTVFTAIIQSSSASVGILQALANTNRVTFPTALPIILGQNIGTCITAIISSIGTNKNARAASFVHLYYNIGATIVFIAIFYPLDAIFNFSFMNENFPISSLGIAITHTLFNFVKILVWLPFIKQLEKVSFASANISNKKDAEMQLFDDRLLTTPSVALEHCITITNSMADLSIKTLKDSFSLINDYNEKIAVEVESNEGKVDVYEDKLGSFLVKICEQNISEQDSHTATKLLHIIGDFERISDHAVNILKSAREINDKKLSFSPTATKELSVLMSAVDEIIDLTLKAFNENDIKTAYLVEPLEQTVDYLKHVLKRNHISRLQAGDCTIELGFILSDLITNFERISDHCSNIASCIIEISNDSFEMHEYLQNVKSGKNEQFTNSYNNYMKKYSIT